MVYHPETKKLELKKQTLQCNRSSTGLSLFKFEYCNMNRQYIANITLNILNQSLQTCHIFTNFPEDASGKKCLNKHTDFSKLLIIFLKLHKLLKTVIQLFLSTKPTVFQYTCSLMYKFLYSVQNALRWRTSTRTSRGELVLVFMNLQQICVQRYLYV